MGEVHVDPRTGFHLFYSHPSGFSNADDTITDDMTTSADDDY